MMIPGCAVVTEAFGMSEYSSRAAADSHPDPGPVELPNVVDATPQRAWPVAAGFVCDVRCSTDVEVACHRRRC